MIVTYRVLNTRDMEIRVYQSYLYYRLGIDVTTQIYDNFLMTHLSLNGNFATSELCDINRCRVYNNIFFVRNICNHQVLSALRSSINLFNKAQLSYTSVNYLFIEKVAGAEMRQGIYKDMAEQSNPQANNTNPTKLRSLLHKKMIFNNSVVLPPHHLFRIPSYRIAPDSASNGSDGTG